MTAGAVAALVGARTVGDPDVRLTAVTHDSRRVGPGSLFCCVPGRTADGHDFAAAGASTPARRPSWSSGALDLDLPQLVVADVRAAMGPAAAEVLGRPGRPPPRRRGHRHQRQDHRRVHARPRPGRGGPPGRGDRHAHRARGPPRRRRTCRPAWPTSWPTAWRTWPWRSRRTPWRCTGSTARRVRRSPCSPTWAWTTSTSTAPSRRYFAAKARLFEPGRARTAVVNLDDVHGRLLLDAAAVPSRGGTRSTTRPACVAGPDGVHASPGGASPCALPLPGRFNVANALAAAEAAWLLGLDAGRGRRRRWPACPPCPGASSRSRPGSRFAVLVDYAHTPDGLEQALDAARELVDPGGRADRGVRLRRRPRPGQAPADGRGGGRLADRVVADRRQPPLRGPAAHHRRDP